VLDERLPGGIDGLELQRRLARAGRQLPIVFISAHEDSVPSVTARAMQDGALAFFCKPFSDADFLTAISRAWQAGNRGYLE
jgi:FixJ family two-component response regulator